MQSAPCVYIMASGFRGTIYTGVTSDLVQRVARHRAGTFGGFTERHGVRRLVWFEMHESMGAAIVREKQVKRWRREWKEALVVERNPTWRDLAEDFGFESLIKKVDPGSRPG